LRAPILHQGSRAELRKFSSDDRSETARRLTNLFEVPRPVEIDGRFYEEKLTIAHRDVKWCARNGWIEKDEAGGATPGFSA
jgi:hypothetical protein